MNAPHVEHHATLWTVDDIPTRMVYAGKRWHVTDTPTRLRNSDRSVPLGEAQTGVNGWRFQATDDDDLSLVFDVYRGHGEWHVHRAYD